LKTKRDCFHNRFSQICIEIIFYTDVRAVNMLKIDPIVPFKPDVPRFLQSYNNITDNRRENSCLHEAEMPGAITFNRIVTANTRCREISQRTARITKTTQSIEQIVDSLTFTRSKLTFRLSIDNCKQTNSTTIIILSKEIFIITKNYIYELNYNKIIDIDFMFSVVSARLFF
jgi:hypothetical protein